MSIGMGQLYVPSKPKPGAVRGVYIRSTQVDALNPELERIDIEYVPSGRRRHLLRPDAEKLLSKFALAKESAGG